MASSDKRRVGIEGPKLERNRSARKKKKEGRERLWLEAVDIAKAKLKREGVEGTPLNDFIYRYYLALRRKRERASKRRKV